MSMGSPEILRRLLWILWALALVLVTSCGLWGVLSAAGDLTGSLAARWMTLGSSVLLGIDIVAMVVILARQATE